MNSVTLIKEKCRGCTTCMKNCPTRAIRVRRGRAHIIEERCIDCGNCIRVCPYKAKKAVFDSFDKLDDYKYKVALPAPSLYGQFKNLTNINIILQGLLEIGFDAVFEVATAAEMISEYTREEMQSGKKLPKPLISSACPASTRLIYMRYPNLIKNVTAHIAPIDLAAIIARREAMENTGLQPDEIGVFFISPCPAKASMNRAPMFLDEPVVDGTLSISEVYMRLLPVMKNIKDPPPIARSGLIGIGWAKSGGEASALYQEAHLAVDGIDNTIRILEDIDTGMLTDITFLELSSCTQGCVGGCLNVENPFVAKNRITNLIKNLPISRNKLSKLYGDVIHAAKKPEYTDIWVIDDDRGKAVEKYARIEMFLDTLPGLDCGSCGAPSCRDLAEDVILGTAFEDDCIFRMRERMQILSGSTDTDAYLPPPFRKTDDDVK